MKWSSRPFLFAHFRTLTPNHIQLKIMVFLHDDDKFYILLFFCMKNEFLIENVEFIIYNCASNEIEQLKTCWQHRNTNKVLSNALLEIIRVCSCTKNNNIGRDKNMTNKKTPFVNHFLLYFSSTFTMSSKFLVPRGTMRQFWSLNCWWCSTRLIRTCCQSERRSYACYTLTQLKYCNVIIGFIICLQNCLIICLFQILL